MSNAVIDGLFQGVAFKATILLIAATLLVFALRRSSAALRHSVWAAALGGLVMLPLLMGVLPDWQVDMGALSTVDPALPQIEPAITHATATASSSPVATTASEVADIVPGNVASGALTAPNRPQSGFHWLLAIWAFGFSVVGLWVAAGVAGARRLRKQSKPIDANEASWTAALERAKSRAGIDETVAIAWGETITTPVIVGLWRPLIVMPRNSAQWSLDRLEDVLVHELAHLRRSDNLFNLIGRLACALFWFHPVAWYAARRLRVEREHAADDVVLESGAKATQYAEHLLNVAQGVKPSRVLAAAALVNESPIGGRISALLDRRRSHKPLSRRMGWIATTLAAAIILPLACAKPKATNTRVTYGHELVLQPTNGIRTGQLERSVPVLEKRLRHSGVKGAAVTVDGDQIRISLPKFDANRLGQIKRILAQRGVIEMIIVDEDADYIKMLAEHARGDASAQQLGISVSNDMWTTHDGIQRQGPMLIGPSEQVLKEYVNGVTKTAAALQLPAHLRMTYEGYDSGSKWRTQVLDKNEGMTLLPIKEAAVGYESCSFQVFNYGVFCDREGSDEVVIAFHTRDVKRFADLTSTNVGARLAILIDNRVSWAPVIQTKIDGGRVSVSLQDEGAAQELADVLAGGSLSAELKIVEDKTL